jgi:hypothetical protein
LHLALGALAVVLGVLAAIGANWWTARGMLCLLVSQGAGCTGARTKARGAEFEIAQIVGSARVTGRQLDPVPGRGWIGGLVGVFGHLPLAVLNRLVGGRLDPAVWALIRWESRVVYGHALPEYRKPRW